MCVFKRSGSLRGRVVMDRAWGRAGEEDSGGYCISLMRKVMVALSGGWKWVEEREREEGLGFICR